MKKKIIIAVVILFALSGIAIRQRNLFLEKSRGLFLKKFQDITGREAAFAGFSGISPFSVNINNIRISGPGGFGAGSEVEIERLSAELSLLRLLKKPSAPELAVLRLNLRSVVYKHQVSTSQPAQNIIIPELPFEINISESRLEFLTDSGSQTVKIEKLSLSKSEKGLTAVQGAVSGSAGLPVSSKIDGEYSNESGIFKGLSELRLDIGGMEKKPAVLGYSLESGQFSAAVKFWYKHNPEKKFIKNFFYAGSFIFEKGSIAGVESKAVVFDGIKAAGTINRDRIEMENFFIAGEDCGLRLSGAVSNYLEDPILDLSIRGENMAGHLAGIFPKNETIRDFVFGGQSVLVAGISGPFKTPQVRLSGAVDSLSAGGFRLDSLNFVSEYDGSRDLLLVKRAVFDILEGAVSLTGRKSGGRTTLKAEFSDLRPGAKISGFSGTLSGAVEAGLDNLIPDTLSLKMDGQGISGANLDLGNIRTSLELKRKAVRIGLSGAGYELSANGVYDGRKIRLPDIKIRPKGIPGAENLLSGSLGYDIEKNHLSSFHAIFSQFRPGLFIPALSGFAVTGNLDASGGLSDGKLKLSSSLELSNDYISVSASAVTENDLLRLSAKNGSGSLRGNFEYNRNDGSGKGSLAFSDFTHKELRKKTGAEFDFNGGIDLDIEQKRENPAGRRKARINLKMKTLKTGGIELSKVSLSGILENEAGSIVTGFSVNDRRSSLVLKLKQAQMKIIPAEISGAVNGLRAGSEKHSADIKAVIHTDYSGPGLKTSAEGGVFIKALGRIGFAAAASSGVFSVSASIPGEIKGDLSYSDGKLKGAANLSGINPSKYTGFFGIKKLSGLSGKLSGKVFISGSGSSPVIHSVLSSPGLSLRGVPYSGDLRVELSGGFLKIHGISLASGEGKKIVVSGEIGLSEKNRAQTGLNFVLEKFESAFLTDLLGLKQNISGIIDGKGKIGGAGAGLEAEISIVSGLLKIDENEFRELRLETGFASGAGEFRKVEFVSKGAHFSAGNIKIKKERETIFLSGGLLVKNLSVANFRIYCSANAEVEILTGRPQPEIRVRAELGSIYINRLFFEKVPVIFTLHNRFLKFESPSSAAGFSGIVDLSKKDAVSASDMKFFSKGETVLSGNFNLSEKKISGEITSTGADIGLIHNLFDAKLDFSGRAFYRASVGGTPDSPVIYAVCSVYDGTYGRIPFDSLNSEVVMKDGILTIGKKALEKKGQYRMTGELKIPLLASRKNGLKSAQRPLYMRFEISGGENLFVKNFVPVIRAASGKFDFRAEVKGTMERPVMRGSLSVVKGVFELNDIFRKISEVKADISMDKNILSVNTLEFSTPDGRPVGLKGKIHFAAFAPVRYDLLLQLSGNAAEFRFMPVRQSIFLDRLMPSVYSKGRLAGKISLKGEEDDYTVSGEISVSDGKFSYPLPEARGVSEDSVSGVKDFIEKAYFDLTIKGGENIWFDNELLSCSLADTEFSFKGTGKNPQINGRTAIIKGQMSYLNNDFNIKSARFEVLDNIPYAEGVFEKTVQRYESGSAYIQDTVEMRFDRAPLESLRPRFVSIKYPDTDERTLAGQALLGVDLKDLKPKEKEVIYTREILKIIDYSLASPLVRSIIKRTGLIDSFEIQSSALENIDEVQRKAESGETLLTPAEILKGSRFMFGKTLGSRLYLWYGLGFDRMLQDSFGLSHEFQLSYMINRNLFLKGSYNFGPDREPERRIGIELNLPFDLPGGGKSKAK